MLPDRNQHLDEKWIRGVTTKYLPAETVYVRHEYYDGGYEVRVGSFTFFVEYEVIDAEGESYVVTLLKKGGFSFKDMKKGDIWGLVSLLIILGGLAALFIFAPKNEEIAFKPEEVSGSALVLAETQEAGVVVDAVLGKPGFISLHQRVGDAPGPIVATSRYLEEGIHSALVIPVTGGLSWDYDYMMLMTVDDGDRTYEGGVDRPVMVNGEVIRVPVSLVDADEDELVEGDEEGE